MPTYNIHVNVSHGSACFNIHVFNRGKSTYQRNSLSLPLIPPSQLPALFAFLYGGGESVGEVGKQLVLQPHRQTQEAVEKAGQGGGVFLQSVQSLSS